MNDDIKLLKEIYSNVQDSQNSLNRIIPKIKDENFKKTLLDHSHNYEKIFLSCENELYKKNEISKFFKSPTNKFNNMFTEFNFIFNNKTTNFADQLIKENNIAIHSIIKHIVEYQGAETVTKDLANTLLKNDRDNIEDLQKFI